MRGSAIALACAVFLAPAGARAQSEDASHRGVLVHIESPEAVDLERRSDDRRNPFYVVCSSPCDEEVPPEGKYRISGDGVRPSRAFLLLDEKREEIVVAPKRSAGFDVGLVLIALGGLAEGVGALTLVASFFSDDPSGGSSSTGVYVGWGLMGGGMALAVGGILLAVNHSSSRVWQTAMPAGSLAPAPILSWTSWRRGASEGRAWPFPATFPLVQLKF